MKAWISVLILSVSATALVGCHGNQKSATQMLRDGETQWNADFAVKDAAKVTSHYADNATVMNPGEKPLMGTNAILAKMKTMMSDPLFSVVIHTDKAEVSGDLGYTQGTYTMTYTNPATQQMANDYGEYVTVYHKAADGSWKATSDIATSAVPTTPPATAK